jgi:hypothetical protein
MLGLFTRPAALLSVIVTGTATFIYHGGDIGDSGLLSFFFMLMSLCILLFGAGKFSLDYLIKNRINQRLGILSAGIFLLFLCMPGAVSAQAPSSLNPDTESPADIEKVPFYLKNNRAWPRRVTFIIYQPQQEGNNTRVKWFLPFQKVKFNLPPKSKIYLATESQVDIVMQGKRIDQDPPFIIVGENLKHKTLELSKGE